jgi:acetyl-CoA carboxylase biotin carboxylase subunit
MFSRVFVANRGEIAVRLIRACHDLGLEAAVLFPEADRDSLPVRMADTALRVPTPPAGPRAAYLDIPTVVEAALRSGAQAVHPGYGFLAENAAFARACAEAGLVFIGPPPEAIEALGDKNRARSLMKAAGVPVVPGTETSVELDQALAAAAEIGYPVLIKAAGGGGGRGMRLARSEQDLRSLFPQARSEARAAFGNPSLYLEKYLEHPRHIEIQVVADRYGRALHLGERECSIQRRFQKMIEEAPSPFVDPDLRHQMGQAAVRGALEAGYSSLGTFEFLVDSARNFYFLEVNTRLQVEHPVTEEISGIDLVTTQIRLAAGEPLPWRQEEIRLEGWAIECRITAEDPAAGFLPLAGWVQEVTLPGGPGIRVDSHLYPGYEVSPYFDSLLAKVIARGRHREEARHRMLRALGELALSGLQTSQPFHQAVLQHPAFVAGDLSTHFVAEHFAGFAPGLEERDLEMAALAAVWETHRRGGMPREDLRRAAEEEARRWQMAGRLEARRR